MTYRRDRSPGLDPRPPGTETPYSTTDFAVPFDVTLPAWVTTDAGDRGAQRAALGRHVRRPGDPLRRTGRACTRPGTRPHSRSRTTTSPTSSAKKPPAPSSPTSPRPPSAADPQRSSRRNVPASLDGSLGCPAEGLTADVCFGLQPELTLRIAVIDLDPAPLLVWLRDIRRPDGQPLEDGTFDAMLASLDFREL